jgi:hypothetical protein
LRFDAKHACVADVCLTRFNEQIEEIERWRSAQIVGFSAARLRAEARESELNQAIVDLSREDFLAGNFDLKSLFSLLFNRFYGEDFVLWLGAGETNGRAAAFQRMADVLEPINTLLEMGMASIESFRASAVRRTPRGISSRIGRPFWEERMRQDGPFVGARFVHGRVGW